MSTQAIANREIAKLVESGVRRLVAGETNQATVRCDLMLALRKRGLVELASNDDWLDAILDVNTQLRQAWRDHNGGIDKAILDAFPAQELQLSGSNPQPCDWRQRWTAAGGQLFDGRMIALKSSDVWKKISNFGFPFPPYDQRSHLWVKDVGRNEARDFGLIDRDTQIQVQRVPKPALLLFEPDPKQLDLE